MWSFVLAVHFLLCIFMIIIILLQSSKGSDMGAAFGGSSQTVFGASGGATFLSKLTKWVAVMFLVTSLTLAYMATRKRESNLIGDDKKTEQKAKTDSVPETKTGDVPKSEPAKGK